MYPKRACTQNVRVPKTRIGLALDDAGKAVLEPENVMKTAVMSSGIEGGEINAGTVELGPKPTRKELILSAGSVSTRCPGKGSQSSPGMQPSKNAGASPRLDTVMLCSLLDNTRSAPR